MKVIITFFLFLIRNNPNINTTENVILSAQCPDEFELCLIVVRLPKHPRCITGAITLSIVLAVALVDLKRKLCKVVRQEVYYRIQVVLCSVEFCCCHIKHLRRGIARNCDIYHRRYANFPPALKNTRHFLVPPLLF